MDEKKTIKIRLSSFLLILSLILIAILTFFIFILLRQDNCIKETTNNMEKISDEIISQNSNITTDYNNLESNQNTNNINASIDNSENKKGTNLLQFENTFYSLEEIALEWRNSSKIKNYKDFEYDLDGDGKDDKITIKAKDDQSFEDENNNSSYNLTYSFELNGKEFAEHSSKPEIYIVDLNKNDNIKEVVIFDEGPSDDPNYTIYLKKGNNMVKLSYIFGYELKCDKNGTIVYKDYINGQTSPEIYFTYNYIENNKIEEKYINIDSLKNNNISSSNLYFSEDYNNAKIFLEQGNLDESKLQMFNIEKLTTNTTFQIINVKFESIDENFKETRIKVILSDGREGYIFHIQWAG